ncbi:DUF6221 family protein [Streptomyces sp. NPDC001795]|uniref:DUF6221 family protein n=1 Tax=unclassified Streptomyces TaxID=2593676 RepID=UPI003333ADE0
MGVPAGWRTGWQGDLGAWRRPDPGSDGGYRRAHVTEHDPRRMLREIDTKRRILDLYTTAADGRSTLRARMREVIDSDTDEFSPLHRQENRLVETIEHVAPVVYVLALPHADRPGFREEWRTDPI